MSYPILNLVSDGLGRVASYRDPGTSPPDAVIWLHGGNGKATEFLHGIRSRTYVIDVAPQGLVTGRNTGWVNPWEVDVPRGARDNLIDLRFISALEDLVRAKFRSIRRVWLCGFSAGGGLVWSAWALRSTINHSFCGLCAVGKKLRRTPENGWIWKAEAVSPIPFAMVHGSKDEPDVEPSQIGTHFSWQESYAEARRVNGNTTNVSAPSRYETCCDRSNFVQLKIASGGVAPSARYVVEGVGHTWVTCESCHTDDLVVERFRAFGLGS